MLREMTDTIIENPIINSPFEEPKRHFRFDDAGITNEIVESRRVSSYFMPIAKARKRSTQLSFETEWTKDRIEENKEINRIRERVSPTTSFDMPLCMPSCIRYDCLSICLICNVPSCCASHLIDLIERWQPHRSIGAM